MCCPRYVVSEARGVVMMRFQSLGRELIGQIWGLSWMPEMIKRGVRTISSKSVGSIMTIFAMVLTVQLVSQSPAQATGVYNLPFLTADNPMWVLDDADIISRASAGQISRELKELATETGNEVRFVTIRRLDYGETIDSFADGLFEKWFPDAEAQANQVLLVLDSLTNNSAIRTGSDVKAVMVDDIAASISDETLQVPLRQGNKYNQAFLDASDRLVAVLSGEEDPGPPVVESTINAESTFTSAEDTDQGSATIIVVGFLIAATIIPMVTYWLYVR